jgi:hypothetical protein
MISKRFPHLQSKPNCKNSTFVLSSTCIIFQQSSKVSKKEDLLEKTLIGEMSKTI